MGSAVSSINLGQQSGFGACSWGRLLQSVDKPHEPEKKHLKLPKPGPQSSNIHKRENRAEVQKKNKLISEHNA
jgi:hypothetical protein